MHIKCSESSCTKIMHARYTDWLQHPCIVCRVYESEISNRWMQSWQFHRFLWTSCWGCCLLEIEHACVSNILECRVSIWNILLLCFCDFRPSVVLGVTNPFFAKTLQHWPHVIRIGESSSNGKKTNPHLTTIMC